MLVRVVSKTQPDLYPGVLGVALGGSPAGVEGRTSAVGGVCVCLALM